MTQSARDSPLSRVLPGQLLLFCASVAFGALLFSQPAPLSAQAPETAGSAALQGVNYDPLWLRESPAALVSMPFRIEMWVEREDRAIELVGDFAAWAAGIMLAGPGPAGSPFVSCQPTGAAPAPPMPPEGAGRELECGIHVFRFVQFGGAVGKEGFEWLLEFTAEGASVKGALTTRRVADTGELTYPARMRLSGRLRLSVREGKGASPVRLVSRRPVTLEGEVEGWPPYTLEWPPRGVILLLAGGPVAFHPEGPGAAAEEHAEPYLVVRRIVGSLGTQPTEFFTRRPEIVETVVVDPEGEPWQAGAVGGLTLHFQPTEIRDYSAAVTHYNLYRNPRPEDMGAWRFFARVPAGHTTALDPQYDGRSRVAYLITHGTEFVFDYRYEGVYGLPVVVEALPGREP